MFFTAQTWPKPSRSKRNRPTIPCSLPPEIIFEILSYLPPKVLIRFMAVCKAWNSTIQSQEFIKAHHDRSTKTNSRTVVLVYRVVGFDDPDFGLSVDLDRDEFRNFVRIELPFRRAIVLGYCNGLVCVRNHTSKRFAVWNPLIQRYKRIPYTAIELPADCWKRVLYGFGYDSTNDDYKLVRVVEFTNKGGHEVGSEVKIYSLKSNSWRKIQSLPCMKDFRMYSLDDSHLSFLNGALHWLICHKSDEKIKRAVSLDLATEKYDEFPIPPIDLKNSTKVVLEVLGRYLCVCGAAIRTWQFKDEVWNLWIMKEYGVAASWTRLYTIDNNVYRSRRRYRYCKPLLFSETREKVLFEIGNEMLCWYDFEKKKIQYVDIPDKPSQFSTAICVGNLRLLNGESCKLNFVPVIDEGE